MTIATIMEGPSAKSIKNETRLAKVHEITHLVLGRRSDIKQLTAVALTYKYHVSQESDVFAMHVHRAQHNTQPQQPSQLRNGYLPEEDESDEQHPTRCYVFATILLKSVVTSAYSGTFRSPHPVLRQILDEIRPLRREEL